MNALGVHALVWAEGWSEPEARHALARTKECGFDLIEIPLLDPTAVDATMTRRLLDEYGLHAACSLGLSPDADVSSEDEGVRARGERLLLDAVSVTADVGASFLGGVTHSAMAKYTRPPSPRGRANAVESLARVAARARDVGVTLGVEPVNRYESNLVNTAEQALALVDDIGAPNVAVHLDTYHMNIEERDAAAAVRDAARRLAYVHVGESNRGYLGAGSVDFGAFFGALASVRYDGPISFESFSSAVVSERFQAALAIWRDPWSDGVHVARHAREFIGRQLSAATNA